MKRFGGQLVSGGSILVRQRGTKFKPGVNVGIGKDDTLFAKITGIVKFEDKGHSGRFISIQPVQVGNRLAADYTDCTVLNPCNPCNPWLNLPICLTCSSTKPKLP